MKRIISLFILGAPLLAAAQNPVIRDQFTADPTARVFNGRVYLYPSHDIFQDSIFYLFHILSLIVS